MSGKAELPPEVYVQEDIEDPTLTGLSSFLVYFVFALGSGLAFATQYFAKSVGFSEDLIVSASQVHVTTPAFKQYALVLSGLLFFAGLLGLPLGLWYSKQPKTIRFRGILAFCFLLLSISALFYVYTYPYSYPFWQFSYWAYLYYDVEALRPLLLRAAGLGGGLCLLLYSALHLGTTGQIFEIDDAYGSAHWGDGEWFAEGKPQTMIGRALSQAEEWGIPIGWRGSRLLFDREGLHTYVQAPTGSGKTVGFVVPTLLLHRGSVLAIDIKRELYYVTARRRNELNGDVHRLDPFADDIETARYNPLDLIDVRPEPKGDPSSAIDEANSIANTLVVKSEGSTQNPFFIDSARQLLYGLILYVCATREKESGDRTLGTVRELLMQDNSSLKETLAEMGDFSSSTTAGDPTRLSCGSAPTRVIREQGNQFSEMVPKEFSSVASTARAQTSFLSSDRIQDSLSDTTFQFEEMQTREAGLSVFLSMPADKLSDYFRWLRLMIISARTELLSLQAAERKSPYQTLFLIEEAPQLGNMDAIDNGLSIDRNAAQIQYMIVTQTFNQLVDAYGEEAANNILGNCRLKMMFGAATRDDAEMVSEMCGQKTVATQTANTSQSRSAGGGGSQKTVSESIQEQSRDLVTPDEVSRISENWVFAFTRGQPPLLLERANYPDDQSVFGEHHDPHPDYSSPEEFEAARRRRIELGIENPPDTNGQNSSTTSSDRSDEGGSYTSDTSNRRTPMQGDSGPGTRTEASNDASSDEEDHSSTIDRVSDDLETMTAAELLEEKRQSNDRA